MKKIAIVALQLVVALLPARADDEAERACTVLHALPFKNDPQRVNSTYDPDIETVTSFLEGRVYEMWADTAAARLQLSDADLADLRVRAGSHMFHPYEPHCDWSVHEDDPAKGVLRFANPLFSSDGKLALAAFSRFSDATTGVGYLCSIRKENGVWVPRCTFTWLS